MKTHRSHRLKPLLLIPLSILLLVSPACAPAATPPPTATPLPTHTYTPEPTQTPSVTPEPTLTPTPTPVPYYDKPGKYLDILTIHDEARWFMLHIPESYQHGTPTALVLSFHGAGSSFEEQEMVSGMDSWVEELGFIAVYPQASRENGSVWQLVTEMTGSADLDFARALIEFLEEKLTIDPKRIYATGFSNGGGLVDLMACNMADKIAAIAPVAGGYVYWADCEPSHPVAVLAFHGTDDEAVAYQGAGFSMPGWAGTWAERNRCDLEPTTTNPEEDVIKDTWDNCDDDASVILYTIEGGGHVWPGSPLWTNLRKMEGYPQNVIATELMLAFFEAHPKP
jgi:polyhydroxybutyrate depolymerase